MKQKISIRFFSIFLPIFFLYGCVEYVAIAGVSTAGAYLGYQHAKVGGLKDRFSNFAIEQRVKILWNQSAIDEPFLDVVAINNTPVIVGAATNKENLEKAKALAFMKSDNVQSLADNSSMGSWNYDLAAIVTIKLFFNFNVASRNYRVLAMRKQVFLVGIARDAAEKKAIIDAVINMDDVEKCFHYIIVLNQTNINEKNNSLDGYMIRED